MTLLISMLESARSLAEIVRGIRLNGVTLSNYQKEIMRETVRCISDFVWIDDDDDEISEYELDNEIDELSCRIRELCDEILSTESP